MKKRVRSQIFRGFLISPLALVIAVGVWLRFDRLTTVPPSLSHDESAIAYNAYSILKTGKDEYGITFPILFRSFDDYKLPGMVYATVLPVAIFGRSELAARLPSATFGILAVALMYFLASELLGNKQWVTFGKRRFDMAILPAFMLSVSPWHVNFSRQLFESNGATFFFMLGAYFLLRSRRAYGNILYAGLAFVASMYFYYSVRLVIPFVLLLYAAMHWKTMRTKWKTTLSATGICLLVFLPLGKEMFSPGGLERISIVSVVHDPNYLKRRDAYVAKMGTSPSVLSKIRYNRRTALLETVIENYGKNISPSNLFVTGTGTYGALYPFEAILVPLGIIALLSLDPFAALITIVWVATAFLPGAFSVNQPNTLRTLIASPAFAILSGLGLWNACMFVTKRKNPAVWIFFSCVLGFTLFTHEFARFRTAYFIDNATNNALSFGDGMKQAVAYAKKHETEYDRIVISGYYWRPYVFLLYWGNADPAAYQNSGTREKFGKYEFTAASWDTNGIKLMDPAFDPNTLTIPGKKTLYLLSSKEYEIQIKHFKKIEDISGRHAQNVFVAAEKH